MDTFENSDFPFEDQGTGMEGEVSSSAYRGAGTGRKESPYANSPYVMAHQPQPEQTAQEPAQPPQSTPTYQRTYYYQPEQPQAVQPKKGKVKKKKKGGFWKKALAAVLVLALVGGSCAVTAGLVNRRWEERTSVMEEQFSQQMAQLQNRIDDVSQQAQTQIPVDSVVPAEGYLTPAQVYARNVDAVVMVYSTIYYYSYGQQGSGTSTGSGFIISEDGYILTNYHVVENATSVSVISHGGEEYSAQVVGYDDTNDVALLKVDAAGLPTVILGSSDTLIVGDQVAAIGNPLGDLTSTMTVGYVSGKERSVSTDGTTINMIQTDAAINSGNSGGPLFNMKGEVVGITTAKYSGESSSGASIEGIGFAIPIDDVMEIVDDLLEYGYVKTAYMGITVLEMDTSVAQMYNLPVGVYVNSVEPDGPAAAAGIQAKDIIIGLGTYRVESYSELARALREYEPGDTVTVTVFRSGTELELTITLAEKPHDTTAENNQQTQPESDMPTEDSSEDWFGSLPPFFGGGSFFGDGNNGG